MAHIRTFEELEALPPTKAEWQLINAAKAGEFCTLGDGSLPESDTSNPAREIRAEVLRYLILGGCGDFFVDEAGVRLKGATIKGSLNLNFTSTSGVIGVLHSRFTDSIKMAQTKCKILDIKGCAFVGLAASGIEVVGTLDLSDARSSSCIRLNNAKIGGALILIGAQLTSSTDYALDAEDAEVTGPIYFHPTVREKRAKVETKFRAKGGISLISSSIGGLYAQDIRLTADQGNAALQAVNFTVNGPARFDGSNIAGQVNLSGATITGDMTCKGTTFYAPNEEAFIARRMKVTQSFIWRKDTKATGAVILDGAHVAELDDNPASWPDADQLSLDGFTYGRIAEYTSYDDARKKWLRNGSLVDGKFFPQPYTQYAKFLRDTGHDAQARQVLLTRETKVRKYERKELGWFRPYGWGLVKRVSRGFWDRLQWIVVGHGHAPFWSIGWLALLIALATIPAHKAWEEGSFTPNSGPVLMSDYWQSLQILALTSPAKIWAGDEPLPDWAPPSPDTPWKSRAPGRDWETFSRYAYAADIVIPLINFGQTEAWAPSTTRGPWGWRMWWLRWVFTVLGWIVTALSAAAITGIIRRE